jgi:predicted nucleic acid-binding protein
VDQADDRDYVLVRTAIEWLLEEATVLCCTSQNLGEFWNTCTRPVDRNGYGLSPEQADHRAKVLEEKLRLLPDSLAVRQQWRKLIVTHHVRGVQVHDARLVAAMDIHDVRRILTFNDTDFLRFSGIEVLHPRRLAAQYP